jgi:transposase
LPSRFGDAKAIHQRFSRWAESGVWARVFAALSADADNEYAVDLAYTRSTNQWTVQGSRFAWRSPNLERCSFSLHLPSSLMPAVVAGPNNMRGGSR